MAKIIKLTESDLTNIVEQAIGQAQNFPDYKKLKLCVPGDKGRLVQQGGLFALSNGTPFCKIISNDQYSKPSPTGAAATTRVPQTTGGAGRPTGQPQATRPPVPKRP